MLASPVSTRACLAVLALWLCAPVRAQSNASSTSPAEQSVTQRLDPTDFKTRFEIRDEYQSLQDGAGRNIIVPRYERAFSKRIALRVEVPYVWYWPNTPGVPDEHGIGDVSVRLLYRVLRGEGYALVAAAEVAFDTAADFHLGSGKNVFSPIVFASIEAPKWNSVVFPYVQQYLSFSGDDSRSDINTTLLRAGVLTRWPNRFYSFLEPSLYIDWEHDARTGFTLELEIGRLVNPNLALWARPGVGVWGSIPGIYSWNFEVGFRYYLD